MNAERCISNVFVVAMILITADRSPQPAHAADPRKETAAEPATIRDLLWVWGNPGMTTEGRHTRATFAQASPAERAQLLSTPNIIMAGNGLPLDPGRALTLTKQVAHADRLIWEITSDAEPPPFKYEQKIETIRKLADQFPQIQAILLDDMSTVSIDKGFKPQHIRDVRALLGKTHDAVKIWGVLYTMSFDRPAINDYVNELDVINLWTWHAKDVVDLEKNVTHCEKLYQDKPIVVGLYLYDYGAGRRMPLDLLKNQCETALTLAHAGRIEGIVFLTINNDPETVTFAADWIKRVGDQNIAKPPGN